MREQSYIIRVYRCAEKESGETVIDGIVEVPANGRRIAFHSIHDLWGILTSSTEPQHKE
jgi:hypothetical protein